MRTEDRVAGYGEDMPRVRRAELESMTYGQVVTRYRVGMMPQEQYEQFRRVWKRARGKYPNAQDNWTQTMRGWSQ